MRLEELRIKNCSSSAFRQVVIIGKYVKKD